MIQENFTWISLFYCIKHDTMGYSFIRYTIYPTRKD